MFISLLPHVSKHSAQLHVSSVEAEISRFHSNQDKQFVHFTLSGEPLQSTCTNVSNNFICPSALMCMYMLTL
jgi:hypothetical protein